MKKTLFLFTDSFPFGKSEQYLNEEFSLLQKNFDEVFVSPINVSEKKRTGFENVNVIDLENKIHVSKRYFLLNILTYIKFIFSGTNFLGFENLKSIHHAWTASDLILDFIKIKKLNPRMLPFIVIGYITVH